MHTNTNPLTATQWERPSSVLILIPVAVLCSNICKCKLASQLENNRATASGSQDDRSGGRCNDLHTLRLGTKPQEQAQKDLTQSWRLPGDPLELIYRCVTPGVTKGMLINFHCSRLCSLQSPGCTSLTSTFSFSNRPTYASICRCLCRVCAKFPSEFPSEVLSNHFAAGVTHNWRTRDS